MKLPRLSLANARRVSQGAFLLLFFYLFIQTESKGADTLGLPARLFLDTDPLLFLATLLSGHTVVKAMLWSILTLALTFILGRVFCGWVCPLGTLNNLVGALGRKKGRVVERQRGWFAVKYWLLAGLLLASLFGVQLTGLLDPLSLTLRGLTTAVYPGFNAIFNGLADVTVASSSKALSVPGDLLYTGLKKTVLAFQQPYFQGGLAAASILLLILLLNRVEKRFWCRYLCPLGALLGLASRWSILKRETAEGCSGCGVCDRNCPAGITPSDNQKWMSMECYECGNCDDPCPKKAVHWTFSISPAPAAPDLGRRKVLLAGAAGGAVAAFSRSTAAFDPERPAGLLIRPPGARDEAEFLAKCVKCAACMKVCPTNALQPAGLEFGMEALWTPVLVPKAGWCEPNCTLCGQVCPTGAIKRLTLPEKLQTRIGTAMFVKDRCLPWAHATPCIVCEEHCPTPTKSIWFEDVEVKDRNGAPVQLKQPHVDLRLCTGCGICVAKCPIQDEPGVRVTSVGESRSKRNQLLLDAGQGPY